MAATFPPRGSILSIAGSTIANAYATGMDSSVFNVGRSPSVLFAVKVVTKAASAVTAVTVKLQQRYSEDDGVIAGDWDDLPSHLIDVAGAAQPKGNTYEIEHAWTGLSAAATTWKYFVLKNPEQSPCDVRLRLHADGSGATGDAIVVYATAW